MPRHDGKLTAKQEMFCKEYLIDLNATQAAIRAGYSEKTAKDIACQNLAKLNIQEKISKLKAEREDRVLCDADWVLRNAMEMFHITKQAQDFSSSKGFLEMCGKHVNVSAFKDKKEVEHKGDIGIIQRVIVDSGSSKDT